MRFLQQCSRSLGQIDGGIVVSKRIKLSGAQISGVIAVTVEEIHDAPVHLPYEIKGIGVGRHLGKHRSMAESSTNSAFSWTRIAQNIVGYIALNGRLHSNFRIDRCRIKSHFLCSRRRTRSPAARQPLIPRHKARPAFAVRRVIDQLRCRHIQADRCGIARTGRGSFNNAGATEAPQRAYIGSTLRQMRRLRLKQHRQQRGIVICG